MFALLLLASATSPVYSYTILGEGTMSCGEWQDRRLAEPRRVLPEAAWVSGYITARARTHSERSGQKVARGIEGSGITRWVDNYCRAHPVDSVEQAGSALFDYLVERAAVSN